MTAVSGSKVIAASRAGRPVPEGWVLDADGEATTDPNAQLTGGGSLELLGAPVAAHKGYGLALMVDVFGILGGNGSGIWQTTWPTWTQGQLFAAWRLDLFIDPGDFLAEMRRVADYVHGVPAKPDATVLLPGERRAASRIERAEHGVPLGDELVAALRQLAYETGAKFPEPAG
jgi:LDH2 family malate/lactate/ureidoglycolate dehydrogenase